MGAYNALWIWYIFYDLLYLPCGLKHNEALLGISFARNRTAQYRHNFRWQDVLSTGLRVFIAGKDGATGVAQVSGGGGTSNDMPWRDKDEDYLHWAYRAMRYAHAKHYPGDRVGRKLKLG